MASTLDAALNGHGGPMGTMVTYLSTTPGKVNKAVDGVSVRVNTLLDKAQRHLRQSSRTSPYKTRGSGRRPVHEPGRDLAEREGHDRRPQEHEGAGKRLLDPAGVHRYVPERLRTSSTTRWRDSIKNADEIIAQMRSFMEFINSTKPQITSNAWKREKHGLLGEGFGCAGSGEEQPAPAGRRAFRGRSRL